MQTPTRAGKISLKKKKTYIRFSIRTHLSSRRRISQGLGKIKLSSSLLLLRHRLDCYTTLEVKQGKGSINSARLSVWWTHKLSIKHPQDKKIKMLNLLKKWMRMISFLIWASKLDLKWINLAKMPGLKIVNSLSLNMEDLAVCSQFLKRENQLKKWSQEGSYKLIHPTKGYKSSKTLEIESSRPCLNNSI
jgi:hypothetical protein